MKTKKLLKRIGQGLLILIAISLLSGFVYEQIGSKKAEKKYNEFIKYGNFIDVGGHKLYYRKGGEGKPTVVFESGAQSEHMVWGTSGIIQEIQQHATTVIYDRAGILYSERGDEEINAENISHDLNVLLQKGGFEKPYILVGHSAAGIYLRPFVQNHDNDIKGIVLIDPSHPDQLYSAPDEIKRFLKIPVIPPKWLVKFASEVGIVRLASNDWMLCYSVKSGAIYDEFVYLMNETGNKSSLSSFGDIPLVVISAGLKSRFDDRIKDEELKLKMLTYLDELQEDIANSSSKGTRIIAEKSGHNMLNSERELIVNEILKLMQPKDILTTK